LSLVSKEWKAAVGATVISQHLLLSVQYGTSHFDAPDNKSFLKSFMNE